MSATYYCELHGGRMGVDVRPCEKCRKEGLVLGEPVVSPEPSAIEALARELYHAMQMSCDLAYAWEVHPTEEERERWRFIARRVSGSGLRSESARPQSASQLAAIIKAAGERDRWGHCGDPKRVEHLVHDIMAESARPVPARCPRHPEFVLRADKDCVNEDGSPLYAWCPQCHEEGLAIVGEKAGLSAPPQRPSEEAALAAMRVITSTFMAETPQLEIARRALVAAYEKDFPGWGLGSPRASSEPPEEIPAERAISEAYAMAQRKLITVATAFELLGYRVARGSSLPKPPEQP